MFSDLQRLKITLLSDGLKVSNNAKEMILERKNTTSLIVEDYATTSGITLQIDKDLWVNAPISEYNHNFVHNPRCLLDFKDNEFVIKTDSSVHVVKLAPTKKCFTRNNKSTNARFELGIIHADRLRLSPIIGCIGGCKFCDSNTKKYSKQSITQLLSVVESATTSNEFSAKHVLISGGIPRKEDIGYLKELYGKVASFSNKKPVDIMMAPIPDLLNIKELFESGIHGLSVNLELYNEKIAKYLMPLKSSIPRREWLNFLEKASLTFGPGKIRSLLIVGLEPLSSTLDGVTAIAQRGCDPVLSPFRPDPNTPLKSYPPPNSDALEEIYLKSLEIVSKYGVKLGPRCIPCQNNTLTFSDGTEDYYYH